MNFKEVRFLKSAAYFKQCVPDQGKEVAFVGRSNAGKSSALNALVGRPIARVSKLPGRTQLINFFEIDSKHRLVDLPGYGFSKVAEEIKKRWEVSLTTYFEKRKSLMGVVLLCDSRHPLKEQDIQLIDFILNLNLPLHLLLTKSDKLSKSESQKKLHDLKKRIIHTELLTVQLFSSLSRHGIDVLEKKMREWLA